MLYSLQKKMVGWHPKEGLWDMYNHLLPQVDDGAICKEEGFDIVVKLSKLGFSGAYCTPHVGKIYPYNTRPFLEKRFAEFTAYLEGKPGVENFELRLAAMYMLDDSFMETLEQGNLLTYDGKHVLVECHQLLIHKNWQEMLEELKQREYIPVLAHPEKYINTFTCEQLNELHHTGVEFQLNLLSLLGSYGKDARKRAIYLLEKGHYASFGTGCHRDSQLKKLLMMKLSALILEKNI